MSSSKQQKASSTTSLTTNEFSDTTIQVLDENTNKETRESHTTLGFLFSHLHQTKSHPTLLNNYTPAIRDAICASFPFVRIRNKRTLGCNSRSPFFVTSWTSTVSIVKKTSDVREF